MRRRKGMLEDIDQDIRDHIERETQDNIDRGMPPLQARYAAVRRFGNVSRVKEEIREVWYIAWIEQLLQDSRFGFRMLRKHPGFTAVAVLTLALGIGANTAIFSVVYAVLFKPLPYLHAEQLFNVFQINLRDGVPRAGWSHPNFVDAREQNRIFSEMVASQQHQLTLTGRGEPSVVNTSVVTPEFFSLFSMQPLAGRVFVSEDGKPGAAPVVILSESLWRSAFAADPEIIGSSVDLDKRSFTVIGIMPAAFRFPLVAVSDQLWIPVVQDPLFSGWMNERKGHWFQVTGRLKPGISVAQAQQGLDLIAARLAQDFPAENGGWTIGMVPLQQMMVGNVKSALLVLLAAVGVVLLIACANIANLLLTRATARAREITIRTTLGAGRVRVIRQLLSEAAVLGLLGGVAGIVLAYWGVRALASLLPSNLPQINAIRVDTPVLGFALLLSLAASCAFGLVPALFTANCTVETSLREGGGRSSDSRTRGRVRNFVAAGEIALAMVLLAVAGLLLRSFAKPMAVTPGFDGQHIVKADISLPRSQYSTPQQWATFSDELLSRIQAQPGFRHSAVAVPIPIIQPRVNLEFDIVGSPRSSTDASRRADYVSVSPDYFPVMGISLLAGRLFSRHDTLSAPRVCVISATLARRYFPNQDPLGKRLAFGLPPDSGTAREIVGIVSDVRDVALGQDPGPITYVPYAQAPFWGAGLLVKSTLSPGSIAAAIRNQVWSIDKDLPVTDFATLPDRLQASVAQPRLRTFLLCLFAAMALILAAIGIFGVISYSVSRRTNEIGIRVALGAPRGTILRMVLAETLVLVLAGLAIGVPCALGAAQLVGHMLFGISPDDPATLVVVATLLVGVAALAGYIPARRAARVEPIIALRYE